jgi:hypothetical protein
MFCVLYYKPITIVNGDPRIINKLETSLTDGARVNIYDCHMFIVQATGWEPKSRVQSSLIDKEKSASTIIEFIC